MTPRGVASSPLSLDASGPLGSASAGAGAARTPPEPDACGTGDLAAIFRGHFDFVWRVARSLGVPLDAVDDAVQDVFLTVHRRLPEFEGRSSLRTWIYAITYHTAQSHRRRSQRNRCEPLESEPASELADPGEQLESAEAGRFVTRFLEGVSAEKRDVFVLSVLEELSAPDVAEILDVKLNTVYSRLRLVRAEFRVALTRRDLREGSA